MNAYSGSTGLIASLLALVLLGSAVAEDDFAGDGVIQSDPSATQDDIHAIAVGDGMMFLGGLDGSPGNGEWRIEKRSLADGAAATGFGIDGAVVSNPTFNWELVKGVAVDVSSLYAVGWDGFSGLGAQRWRVEKRRVVDGGLDAGFGTGGVITGPNAPANAVLLNGGALYIAGGESAWRVEKRTAADGTLVGGFGGGGIVSTPGGTVYAMVLAGGSLYVAGTNDYTSWRIEKRDPASGQLLSTTTESFTDVGCGYQGGFALAADASHLYVAGEAAGQWRVEKRSLSNLQLVFAQSLPGSGSCDAPQGIAIDASAMYVAGHQGHTWRIEKRNLFNGQLVSSFGDAGVVSSGNFFSEAHAIAIDGAFMYVAGFDDVAGSDTRWRVERRWLTDGALAPSSATSTTIVGSTTTTTSTIPNGSCVPFTLSDCSVKARFRGTTPSRDSFNVRCLVTLGTGSDGIDPVVEGVRVLLTDTDSPLCNGPCFAQTVTPRRVGRCWRFKAKGTTTGLRGLKLCDHDASRGVYRLLARSGRTNLQCLNGPAPWSVGLTIGDDCTPPCPSGTTTTSTVSVTTTTSTTLGPGGCVPQVVSRFASVATNMAPNTEDWFAPEDAAQRDDRTAFVRLTFGNPSSYLAANGFGFAIPSAARIDGIVLSIVRAARDPGSIRDHAIRLVKAGAILATERGRSDYWTPSYTTVPYGSPTDRWGTTWTPAEINAPGFGAALRAQYDSVSGNNDAGVDALEIAVHFCH